jgi:hypothetical protein
MNRNADFKKTSLKFADSKTGKTGQRNAFLTVTVIDDFPF